MYMSAVLMSARVETCFTEKLLTDQFTNGYDLLLRWVQEAKLSLG